MVKIVSLKYKKNSNAIMLVNIANYMCIIRTKYNAK